MPMIQISKNQHVFCLAVLITKTDLTNPRFGLRFVRISAFWTQIQQNPKLKNRLGFGFGKLLNYNYFKISLSCLTKLNLKLNFYFHF